MDKLKKRINELESENWSLKTELNFVKKTSEITKKELGTAISLIESVFSIAKEHMESSEENKYEITSLITTLFLGKFLEYNGYIKAETEE